MSARSSAVRDPAPLERTDMREASTRRLSAVPKSIDLRTAMPDAASELVPRLRRGMGGFMVLAVGILASGLFALLLLNTTLGEGSFRIRAMQLSVSQLSDQQQQLEQQVALAESPLALQQRAVALGMVPSSTPVFLRLSDGHIIGVPEPAPTSTWLQTSMLASATRQVKQPTAKTTTKLPATSKAKPGPKPTTQPKH